ncbi:DUF1800 domain-containing protein [Saccharicrinis aurantiacus]|uniref:DUF1800 domain-containing protein n=1 Tax=Saccharicrinis aurantiacus TaxID=1849719 RepID=UPI0008394C91|nr:DUF1800 domain-containing protein [Saccharicrinis aurantiacus]
MKESHYIHLLKRAQLGVSPNQLQNIPKSRKTAVDNLFNKAEIKSLSIDYSDISFTNMQKLSPQERMKWQKMNREKLQEFNLVWFNRMASDHQNIQERMVLFWANHFVASSKNIKHAVQYNNLLREHALGNFREFVLAVSKDAAMIQYLDNNKNKKEAPNENYARELMELFTLGRDVLYTESDIKQAARAFTGWKATPDGRFLVAKRQHDEGEKVFLGKRGNFSGEDIVNIILENKECAQFICTKVYKEFVSENVDAARVKELSEVLYANYDIEELMRYLFSAKWFYNEANIASKIKSPLEAMVSMYALMPYQIKKSKQLMSMQRVMGQVLLNPPNVAGWPGGQSWIDSNTLMYRMRMASILYQGGVIDSDSDMASMERSKGREKVTVSVDWSYLDQLFQLSNRQQAILLFGKQLSDEVYALVNDTKPKDKLVKMLSVPDFQMC